MFVGSANNEIGGISSQSGASTSQPSAPGQGRTPAHRQQQYQPTISTADPMGLTHVSISNLTNQNARYKMRLRMWRFDWSIFLYNIIFFSLTEAI